MLKIRFKNKIYNIPKDNIKYILERLSDSKIKEDEIINLMKKYKLYDEHFLKEISKL